MRSSWILNYTAFFSQICSLNNDIFNVCALSSFPFKRNPEFTLRASCSRIRPLESTVILYLDSIHHDTLLWFFNMVSLVFSCILLIPAIQLTLIKSPYFFCKLLIMIFPLKPENCYFSSWPLSWNRVCFRPVFLCLLILEKTTFMQEMNIWMFVSFMRCKFNKHLINTRNLPSVGCYWVCLYK